MSEAQELFQATFEVPDGGAGAVYTVEPDLAAPVDELVVVRFFIPGATAGALGLLAGDDRGSSSDPEASSRVTVAFYPRSGLVAVAQTESCLTGVLPDYCERPSDINTKGDLGRGNDVDLAQVDEQSFAVDLHVINSMNEQYAPVFKVDASFQFDTVARGGVRVDYNGESYPAQEVLYARGDRARVADYERLKTGGYANLRAPRAGRVYAQDPLMELLIK